jgi:hypothetical protein
MHSAMSFSCGRLRRNFAFRIRRYIKRTSIMKDEHIGDRIRPRQSRARPPRHATAPQRCKKSTLPTLSEAVVNLCLDPSEWSTFAPKGHSPGRQLGPRKQQRRRFVRLGKKLKSKPIESPLLLSLARFHSRHLLSFSSPDTYVRLFIYFPRESTHRIIFAATMQL